MAVDADKRLEVDELLSFGDNLVALLDSSKHGEAIAQAGESARMLQSVCRSEFDSLELHLKECQEKICACKEKIDKTKADTIADDELKVLQSKLEEKLMEEKQLRQALGAVDYDLYKLDRQRVSIEERKDAIKKKEKAMRKAEKTLSMCVSVTKIMPNLGDREKISGYIIENKKKMEMFEFEKTASPVEVCNQLWKKI